MADIDNITPATCLCYALDVTHENDTQENTVTPKNTTHDNNVAHENCTQEDDVTPEKSTHENVTGDNCPMKSDRGTEENGTSSNNGIVNKPLTFKDTCKEDLLNEGLMTKLVDKLHANNCLQDFVNLVKLLANGTMSPMIIAFLCLDVAHLLSCITTTHMRFRRATRQFWEVVYRISHGKILRLFSGSKKQGDLQGKKTTRGHFYPGNAKINFAVPSEKKPHKIRF